MSKTSSMNDSEFEKELRSSALDRHVDYIRQVAIVVFAIIGAYWSITLSEDVFLPWAVIVFFGSTVYVLFLPYKRALLVTDQWEEITKIKALGMVFLGIPLYIVPSILIMISPSYSEILPTVQSYISNYQLDSALLTLINVIPPFLVGAIFVSVFMNLLFHGLMRQSGYDMKEIRDITRYGTDRSGPLVFGFALIITFSVLYLSAGWAYPEFSNIYILGTLIMSILLIAYGHLYVRCYPSALKLRHRRLLEIAFVVSVFLSSLSIYLTIISGLIAVLIMLIYYQLSIEGLETLGSPSELIRKKKMELEEKEIERDIISFTFYKQHSYAYFTVSLFVILWFLFLFSNFVISVEVLFVGFVFPYVVYWTIPRIWLKWISFRKDL